RANTVPRCIHRRLGPNIRGRREELVFVDNGAAADVIGHLQSVPNYPDHARPCK
ncbi:unnamed protein product, partial [Ectocarpus sp. 8 AP-2014]